MACTFFPKSSCWEFECAIYVRNMTQAVSVTLGETGHVYPRCKLHSSQIRLCSSVPQHQYATVQYRLCVGLSWD